MNDSLRVPNTQLPSWVRLGTLPLSYTLKKNPIHNLPSASFNPGFLGERPVHYYWANPFFKSSLRHIFKRHRCFAEVVELWLKSAWMLTLLRVTTKSIFYEKPTQLKARPKVGFPAMLCPQSTWFGNNKRKKNAGTTGRTLHQERLTVLPTSTTQDKFVGNMIYKSVHSKLQTVNYIMDFTLPGTTLKCFSSPSCYWVLQYRIFAVRFSAFHCNFKLCYEYVWLMSVYPLGVYVFCCLVT